MRDEVFVEGSPLCDRARCSPSDCRSSSSPHRREVVYVYHAQRGCDAEGRAVMLHACYSKDAPGVIGGIYNIAMLR